MKSSKLKCFLSIATLSLISSNAYAFPVLLSGGIGYLFPALAILFGGSAALKKLSFKNIVALLVAMVVILMILFDVNGTPDAKYAKQLYPNTISNNYTNTLSYFDYDDVKDISSVLENFDEVGYIKLQDVNKTHFVSDYIFGFDDVDKAIRYIEKNNIKKLIIASENISNSEFFSKKLKEKIDIKVVHINSYGINYKCGNYCDLDVRTSDEVYEALAQNSRKTRLSTALNKYNIVYASNIISTLGSIYTENLNYFDPEIYQVMGDEYANSILNNLDKKKETIVVFLQYFDRENERKAKQAIVGKISEYSSKPVHVFDSDQFGSITGRTDDMNITEFYPHESTFYNQAKLYSRMEKDVGYFKYLCFSDECTYKFGLNHSVNLDRTGLVSFDNGVQFDNKVLASIDIIKHGRIIISPEDSFSVLIGRQLGKHLTDLGYDFRGFTYHHSVYYSDMYLSINEGKLNIEHDSFLTNLYVDIAKHFNLDEVDLKHEVSLETVIFIMLLLGGFASVNCKPIRVVALAMSIPVGVLIGTKFHLPSDVINHGIVSTDWAYALLMLFAVIKGRDFVLPAVMFVVCFLIYEIDLLDVTSNIMIISYLVGAIPVLVVRRVDEFLKMSKKPEFEGGKYKITKRYIEDDKHGYLVSSIRELRSIKLKGEWLLRSNHNTPEENALSGCFDSFPVNQYNVESVLTAEIERLTPLIGIERIQFWLMPKENCILKGVASSFGKSEAQIMIAIGQGDSVTEGNAAENFEYLREFKVKDKTHKRIIEKLKEIERSENRPVIMEFGVRRNGEIAVFQVKYQSSTLPSFLSEKVLSGMCLLDHFEFMSTLGSQVVRELSEQRLIISNGTICSIKPSETNRDGEYDLSDANLQSLINDVLECDISRQKSLSGAITKMKSVCRPIFDMYFTKSEMIKRDIRIEVVSGTVGIIKEQISKHGELTSYDIGGEIKAIDSANIFNCNTVTYHDVLHCMIILSLFKIRVFVEQYSNLDACSGSSIVEFDEGDYYPRMTLNTVQEEIVINGNFEGERVSLDEFLLLPEDKKPHVVIFDTSIPVSVLMESMKAKAIIIKHGSLLSHLSMTAKKLRVPLKIGF